MTNAELLAILAFLVPLAIAALVRKPWRFRLLLAWLMLPLIIGAAVVAHQAFRQPDPAAGIAQAWWTIILLGGIALIPWSLATGAAILLGALIRKIVRRRS